MKHQRSSLFTVYPGSLILFVLLLSCNRPDYNWSLNKKTTVNLSGTWTEYWPQVDDHDTYVIDHPKSGKISMTCPSYEHYTFSEIRLSGYDFSFTVTNWVDSADIYVLNYTLELSNDQKTMRGHVKTNHGVRDRVRLVKE
jgi:hypothetical protein